MSVKAKILGSAVFLLLGFILWHSRQIFFYRYEPEYLENLYYHSQWNIPNSPRGISDGLLYQFVGYRLVEGENPFNVNFEVPPLGKYLYGLSEWFLGTPYPVSLGLYLAALVVLYRVSRELFSETDMPWWSLLVFVSAPFVATQIASTMLDLPLMFFYLTHLWFFLRFLRRANYWDLGLAGGFLGLAAGTKFGAYIPLVLLASLVLVIARFRQWRQPEWYLLAGFAGYVVAWTTYFIHHPNPIPWARLHQKMTDFYFGPSSKVDYLNQWRGIFANTYQGWWQKQVMVLGDWSPLLPLGVIAFVAVLVWAVRNRDWRWLYLGLLGAIFLLVNTFIAFWPRYLMPAIPLFALAAVFVFKRLKLLLILLVLANLPFLYSSLAVPDYRGPVDAVTRFISTRAYRELYRSITPNQRTSLAENTFAAGYENFLEQLDVRQTEVAIKEVVPLEGEIRATLGLKYRTRWGELSRDVVLRFVENHNQFYLVWDWDYLWPGYGPQSQIKIENADRIPLKEILDEAGQTVAVRSAGKAVYAIPRVLRIPQDTDLLAQVVGESGDDELALIQKVIPDHYPRFVGYLDPTLGADREARALAINSVTFREVEYLRTVAVAKTAVPLIARARQEHPELFYQPAKVWLQTDSGWVELPLVYPKVKDVSLRFK